MGIFEFLETLDLNHQIDREQV